MLIKFRLSKHNEWDREIINWLEKLPRGYRPALIKQKLYEALNSEKTSGNPLVVEKRHTGSGKLDKEVNEKIEKLLKI